MHLVHTNYLNYWEVEKETIKKKEASHNWFSMLKDFWLFLLKNKILSRLQFKFSY